jgi:hypothetical protein
VVIVCISLNARAALALLLVVWFFVWVMISLVLHRPEIAHPRTISVLWAIGRPFGAGFEAALCSLSNEISL